MTKSSSLPLQQNEGTHFVWPSLHPHTKTESDPATESGTYFHIRRVNGCDKDRYYSLVSRSYLRQRQLTQRSLNICSVAKERWKQSWGFCWGLWKSKLPSQVLKMRVGFLKKLQNSGFLLLFQFYVTNLREADCLLQCNNSSGSNGNFALAYFLQCGKPCVIVKLNAITNIYWIKLKSPCCIIYVLSTNINGGNYVKLRRKTGILKHLGAHVSKWSTWDLRKIDRK